ncbi:MAG: penicillin-binding transpeptidase domain-containing protein [Acutalibacteraceae bacterium]|nr:penicillin-binding transpeptidase domain-containing protein [Acutalibacteraceae bacterium]
MKYKVKKFLKRLSKKKISFTFSKSALVKLLSFILVLSIPVAVIRIMIADNHLSHKSIQKMSGIYGTVTDRFDQTLYDGQNKNEKLFGNIIYGGNMMENVITVKYRDLLTPGKVSYLLGYRTVEEQSRVLKTSLLSEESTKQLTNLFGNKKGCCFAYNYKTGEVYTAISLPGYSSTSDASYINRCFSSVYIPGSTMKFVTSLIAIEQNIDLNKITFTCSGSLTLPDGNTVTCPGSHGKQSFNQGLANSCNCFFAHIIMKLDVEKAINTLKNMGFAVNQDTVQNGKIDRLSKETSRLNMTNTATFKNVWNLIGQGSSQVNPVDMAVLAGAVANGGKAASPYIVQSIVNPNKKNRTIYEASIKQNTYLPEKTAEKMQKHWGKAVEIGYYPAGYSKSITYAKTGTAETDSKGSKNKTLVGVIEESNTAFYIVVEDWHSGDMLPATIANTLVSVLPKTNQ